MRSFAQVYDIVTPLNLNESLSRLPEWQPFPCGTGLVVLFEGGKLRHSRFMNIRDFAEWKGIDGAPDYVTRRALTTYSEVLRDAMLRQEFPMLCHAAAIEACHLTRGVS